MQFLSDVYLRCPDCDGRRYAPRCSRCKLDGRSIADVLEMTVAEALRVLRRRRARSQRALQPLADVGLEYLQLGQPVPTLSGGEAQRLKLAGHLAERIATGDPRAQRRRARHAVPVRRADDRPALRRHREAAARVPQADRRRPFAGRDRAQPRRHPRRRLDHRPRPRRRRRGRRGRRRRHAGGGDGVRGIAHRQGAARRTKPRSAAPALRRLRAPHALRAAARRAARRRDPHPQRARAQPEEHRRRDSARPLHRRHRRLGHRQVHARLRHPVRRGPAPLSRIAERLRAPVRAAGVAPRRRRDLRHPADGGDRAAHEPRRPQEHGRDADRDLPLPAPALREARHAALPRLRRADRAAERGQHRRRSLHARLPRPAHRRCSRRWSSTARAIYTDLAKWAARQGLSRTCASTAHSLPTRALAAARPLQASTRSSCRSPSSRVDAGERARAARGARRARSSSARASCTCCARARLARSRQQARSAATSPRDDAERSSRRKRACPSCGRSFPELDPRLFSFNSKHGWCAECYGTGAASSKASTRTQTGEECRWWIEWLESDAGLPRVRGQAAQPRSARRALSRAARSPT